MKFNDTKNYLNKCSEEFCYCLKKIISNTHEKHPFANCLLLKEAPLLSQFNDFADEEIMMNYTTEINYIRHIMQALYVIKKEEADEVWFTYFYKGKKEIYYERSVDYRHRKKASVSFFNQLHNN